jgi:SAM-dependent methyltransferase
MWKKHLINRWLRAEPIKKTDSKRPFMAIDPRSTIRWTTDHRVAVGRYMVACAPHLEDGYRQSKGVVPVPSTFVRKHFQPLLKLRGALLELRNALFVDGFIEREAGRLIRKYISADDVFLEIGCGAMNLRRFLPKGMCYNAFDLLFSDITLAHVLAEGPKINICVASATEIPVESNTATLMVSTETFPHIPKIDLVIQELHRIAAPNAVLICSNPNRYCQKYVKKGAHEYQVHKWTYDGFIRLMEERNFGFLEGYMKGWWIPFPLWLTKTSYQLPLTSKSEYLNTTFFHVFRAIK